MLKNISKKDVMQLLSRCLEGVRPPNAGRFSQLGRMFWTRVGGVGVTVFLSPTGAKAFTEFIDLIENRWPIDGRQLTHVGGEMRHSGIFQFRSSPLADGTVVDGERGAHSLQLSTVGGGNQRRRRGKLSRLQSRSWRGGHHRAVVPQY